MKLFNVVFVMNEGRAAEFESSHFAWAESATHAIEAVIDYEGAFVEAPVGEEVNAAVAEMPSYDGKGPGYCDPVYRMYRVIAKGIGIECVAR